LTLKSGVMDAEKTGINGILHICVYLYIYVKCHLFLWRPSWIFSSHYSRL